jgi:1-deoxy-D-xylulose-5-phosphate synthase
VIFGGAGSAVNEFLLESHYQIPVLNLGLPDEFLDHGKTSDMLSIINLDGEKIVDSIKEKMNDCEIHSEKI